MRCRPKGRASKQLKSATTRRHSNPRRIVETKQPVLVYQLCEIDRTKTGLEPRIQAFSMLAGTPDQLVVPGRRYRHLRTPCRDRKRSQCERIYQSPRVTHRTVLKRWFWRSAGRIDCFAFAVAGRALIADGKAAGPKRKTFVFANNRLERECDLDDCRNDRTLLVCDAGNSRPQMTIPSIVSAVRNRLCASERSAIRSASANTIGAGVRADCRDG